MTAVDLESAAEELYAGSPDDFVERRTALVGEARKARDRELVKQIGALRRPTRTAWLGNLLAHERPDDVSELLELGEALADAQRRGSGTDLRRLSTERRQLVDRLTQTAIRLGTEHGYEAPDSARQEVAQTLQAALGDDDACEQLRSGRLTTAVSYGGFGPFVMPETVPEQEEPEHEQPEQDEPEQAPFDKLREQRDKLREQRDKLREQRDELRERVEAAEVAEAEVQREAEEATARADELAERLEELRADLATAETNARTARRHLQEVRRTVEEAQQALAALDEA